MNKKKIEKRLKVMSTDNYHLAFITERPSEKVWEEALKTVKNGVIQSKGLMPYYLVLIFDDQNKQMQFEHELLQMESPTARAEKNRLVVNLKAYIDLLQYKLPIHVVTEKFVPVLKEAEVFADIIDYTITIKDHFIARIVSVSQTAEKELVVLETPFPHVIQKTSLCTYSYKRTKNGLQAKFTAVLRGLENTIHTLGVAIASTHGKLVNEFNKQKSKILEEIRSKIGNVRQKQEVSEVVEDPQEAIDMLKDLL